MSDDKSPTGEIPSQPAAPAKSGFTGKVIASVFTAVCAPVLVAIGVKYADPANWNKEQSGEVKKEEVRKDDVKKEGIKDDPITSSPLGTLEVFAADAKLEVTVKQQGKVVVEHTTSRKLSLKPGEYELELSGGRAGLHPSPPRVTVTAGGQASVATWRAAATWPVADLKGGKVKAPNPTGTPLFDETFQDAKKVQFKPLPYKHAYTGAERALEHGRLVVKVPAKINSPAALPPGTNFSDFAVKVTAKVNQDRQSEWGLWMTPSASAGDTPDLLVTVNGEGELTVSLFREADEGQKKGPRERDRREAEVLERYGFRAGPFAHPAIKRVGEPNTLLCVIREGLLEAYVNGVAVCDPVALPVPMPAVTAMRLWAYGRSRPEVFEFERVTVWPAKGLPTPKARGAVAVK